MEWTVDKTTSRPKGLAPSMQHFEKKSVWISVGSVGKSWNKMNCDNKDQITLDDLIWRQLLCLLQKDKKGF